VEECDLHDLGFSGDVFTWQNKQTKGSSHIQERLDRALTNPEWRMKCPFVQVKNADPYHSDHRHVIIDTEEGASGRRPSSGNNN
jgi:hypothetical protein